MEEAQPCRLLPSWSDIPVDLAGLVLGRLPAHADRVRFAAVCPQWCAAARQVPLPPPMPMLLLPDATVYSLPGSKPFHFPDCAGYTDACGDWLVFPGEEVCLLRDPFSNATVTLPPLSRSRTRVWVVDDECDDGVSYEWMEMDEGEEMDVFKIIFCSSHLIAAIVKLTNEITNRIVVCRPGGTSWWSICVDDEASLFADVVFHQGNLYALDSNDTLFAVHISVDHGMGDPWVFQIQEVISGLLASSFAWSYGVLIMKVTYLVQSRGALLVVCRRIGLRLKPGRANGTEVVAVEQNWFEVFEANFGQSRWAKVTTLGTVRYCFYVDDAADLFVSLITRCQGIASSSWRMMMRIAIGIVHRSQVLAVSTA
ncbi:unnamed protein product [Urochloa decumbens]|uniref:KIB1-4 beta-propeller domain-containing protein n=1 Tax=Urochloa decumbens TaxID=240449 RepID=A0ABC9B107_9POAL